MYIRIYIYTTVEGGDEGTRIESERQGSKFAGEKRREYNE